MSIKNLTAEQAREKLGVKQDELGKIFEEAKTDDGRHDYSKVKCLGVGLDSVAVAEKVHALNLEANELAKHAETLEAADKAAADHADREKGLRNFPLPGKGGGDRPANQGQFKSLGQQVVEAKEFKAWSRSGTLDLVFGEMLPSEFLAKAVAFETLGTKAAMTTAAGFAPESVRLPGFVEAATRPIQLLDILPMGRTGQASVPYMEETTRTHGAAETAEGGTFAESEFAFTQKSSPVRKITDSLPVTDEQLEDVDLIESYINGRLSFGIRQRLDLQCYDGDGAGTNLRGIHNVVGIQTQAKGGDSVMDAFYKAMTKVRVTGRAMPTHHVMHPEDWQDIRLTRTADGIYIFGSPTDAGPDRLWGLPVVQNDAKAAGTGLVGSFQPAWISLLEKRGVDIQVGYVDDQFGKGMRTVRGDMRAALLVPRPPAFCSVTGI
jgi:HK97 family phage major capsid protein